MRVLLKPNTDTVKLQDLGILPRGVLVRIDHDTGRKYFNYIYRLSTNVDWNKISPYVEAVSNLIKRYCDFFEEGIYEYEGGLIGSDGLPLAGRIKIIVILKRNESSGVSWEEVEVYGLSKNKYPSPGDLSIAYALFAEKKFTLTVRWSSGKIV